MAIELAITDETPEEEQAAGLTEEEILDCFLAAPLQGSYRAYLVAAGRAIESKVHERGVIAPLTLEQSIPLAQPCCGEFANCHRACTPRGRWEASQQIQAIEREFVTLDDLLDFIRRLQQEVREARAAA